MTYHEWEQLLLDKINLSELTEVISGGAKSLDTLVKLFAARHHIPYMEFAPQYAIYGRYATLKRSAMKKYKTQCEKLAESGAIILVSYGFWGK